MMMTHEHYISLCKGAVGTVIPTIALVASSKLNEIEQGLRILNLSGGLVVVALTIISFRKKKSPD